MRRPWFLRRSPRWPHAVRFPGPSRRPLLAMAACGAMLSTAVAASARPATTDLSTVAERSGFVETGRYAEVESLCAAFAGRYPQAVRCERFGTSAEGRPLLALVVSSSGALQPEQAKQQGLPVLLVQGGIHPGEIDGKDAGFLALRELLDGGAAPGALDKQVLVFVPVFNVDGHERFQAWNRPNQRGPKEMGFRATAQNYNLNRDYVKADAPEMRAMLELVKRWDPLVTVDLHVTDGAQFQYDVAVQVEPLHEGDAELAKAGLAMRDRLLAQYEKRGGLPLPYYPTFLKRDDPTSGFAANVYTPRYSTGYFPMRNRFAILVETHSWKDYPHRVRTTHDLIVDLVADTADQGKRWLRLADEADQRAAALAGTRFPLSWKQGGEPRTIDFRGYAYTRTQSEVSGALWTRYDEGKPQIWRVPLYEQVVPDAVAALPHAGYVVSAGYAGRVAALLDLHGIGYSRIGEALAEAPVEVLRDPEAKLAATSFEGRQRVESDAQWQPERRDIPAGSLYVPIAQPAARLVATLFEPAGPDSLLAWGEFNAVFERKEYLEAYVAEDVAREQLQDPAVAAEFAKRLAEDPAFAASPAKRLEFFARRHPSWDERLGLYPVFRTQQPLP